MKKTVLHAALFAMTIPMSLYGLGLGDMTVKSSLDQPFLAEIELIDVGSAPLPGIRVGIADPQNFKQTGMAISPALSLLSFKIERNNHGRYIIRVQSVERMTEPYMELVVDLAWPQGQLYKAYTVLLDPPGYQLVDTTAQSSATHYKQVSTYQNEPGVINKTVLTHVAHNPVELNDTRKKATYGPTIANENVWQIAQRYKTSEIILPQVVLAIVGANPDAFSDGNLNGLKVGIRLVIPPTEDIQKVPADLATEEVMAHDKAWNDKKTVDHVLNPPYMNAQPLNPVQPAQNSQVPAIPKLTVAATPIQNSSPQVVVTNSIVPVIKPAVTNQQSQNAEQDAKTKAELSITTAAVESVRESNALLMEQLHLLQKQNKKLQQQLDKRDKEMEIIRTQMAVMMKERLAVAAQVSSATPTNHETSYWPWFLLLLAAAGCGGFAYWYFKIREQQSKDEPYLSDTPIEPKPFIPPVVQEPQPVESEKIVAIQAVQQPEPELPENKMEPLVQDIEEPATEVEQPVIAEYTSVEPEEIPVEFENKTPDSSENDVIEMLKSADEPVDKTMQKKIEEPNTDSEGSPENEAPEKDFLEFETGLHELIQEKPSAKVEKAEATDDSTEEEGLDFVSFSSEEHLDASPAEQSNEVQDKDKSNTADDSQHDNTEAENALDIPLKFDTEESLLNSPDDEIATTLVTDSTEEPAISDDKNSAAENSDTDPVDANFESKKPLKNIKALNTLLDLAKTYMGMDDFESARHCLEEVREFGNDTQKAESQALLDEIKGK